MIFIAVNLELRSPTASPKEDLVKLDFEHAYRQQGPMYEPSCYCAFLNKDIVNLPESCWMFFGLEDRNDLK